MYNSQEIVKIIKMKAKKKNKPVGKMLEECELSKNALSSMQSGYLPRIENLVKIADYLDISVDYLLGRTEKSSSSELTENEQELLSIFAKLTPEQQNRLIGRAEAMAEQNDSEAIKKDKVS